MARRTAHGGEHDQRVQPQRAQGAVAKLAVHTVAETVRHRKNIREKDKVEAAILQDASKAGVVTKRGDDRGPPGAG